MVKWVPQTFEPVALDAVILGKTHASEKEFEEKGTKPSSKSTKTLCVISDNYFSYGKRKRIKKKRVPRNPSQESSTKKKQEKVETFWS